MSRHRVVKRFRQRPPLRTVATWTIAVFKEGVTVYFPVFVPGALFHLGDGHAVQGDGEIVGTGIEISFDVQFTVEVLKGKSINWPRAENSEYILAAGNARPLDQAVQHATTELLRWLGELGLEKRAAHILLGQAVEYDMGNVFRSSIHNGLQNQKVDTTRGWDYVMCLNWRSNENCVAF